LNATRAAGAAQDFVACAALASEAGELRKVLVRQLGALSAAGGGELPVLRDHLWLSQADITRSTQTLGPMLKKARKDLEKLLEVRVPVVVSCRTSTLFVSLTGGGGARRAALASTQPFRSVHSMAQV
jgi:hypothetical protein